MVHDSGTSEQLKLKNDFSLVRTCGRAPPVKKENLDHGSWRLLSRYMWAGPTHNFFILPARELIPCQSPTTKLYLTINFLMFQPVKCSRLSFCNLLNQGASTTLLLIILNDAPCSLNVMRS